VYPSILWPYFNDKVPTNVKNRTRIASAETRLFDWFSLIVDKLRITVFLQQLKYSDAQTQDGGAKPEIRSRVQGLQ
jgi:hypothetical protein